MHLRECYIGKSPKSQGWEFHERVSRKEISHKKQRFYRRVWCFVFRFDFARNDFFELQVSFVTLSCKLKAVQVEFQYHVLAIFHCFLLTVWHNSVPKDLSILHILSGTKPLVSHYLEPDYFCIAWIEKKQLLALGCHSFGPECGLVLVVPLINCPTTCLLEILQVPLASTQNLVAKLAIPSHINGWLMLLNHILMASSLDIKPWLKGLKFANVGGP